MPTTHLLVFRGNAGEYGHVSKRVLRALGAKSIGDVSAEKPTDVLARAAIPGTVVFEADCEWNGIDTYAWAPINIR